MSRNSLTLAVTFFPALSANTNSVPRNDASLGFFPPEFVPTRPKAVNIAVVHPEDGIVRRPRDLSHTNTISDQYVNVSVQIKVQPHAESLLGAIGSVTGFRQHIQIQGAGIILVNRLARICNGVSAGAKERIGCVIWHEKFGWHDSATRIVPIRQREGFGSNSLLHNFFEIINERIRCHGRNIILNISRTMRLASVPRG